MKWFGRRAGRDDARPTLSRQGFAMRSGEWPQNYDTQLRDAYLANPVAQRAVKLIAEGVGGAPLKGSDLELVRLVRARSAGQVLVETAAAQLLLHGNAYVQILTGSDGAVSELIALRPERVKVEPDARGWPGAYSYTVGGSTMKLVAEDEGGRPGVVHLKAFHPLDDHYGLGCLGAAAPSVAIHNAAAKWNKALLDNAARPSGALIHDPGDGSVLAADQIERLRGELEAGFAGAANAGRPMLLEGGIKWQSMSLTPADMDFVGLKAAAAREIALAFGVPPMLMGLPADNSYANYREANRALWRLAILPLADKILSGLAQGLRGWFPEGTLAVDVDRVTALAEDRERLWAQVAGADFLTPEEKRAMVGIGVEEDAQ